MLEIKGVFNNRGKKGCIIRFDNGSRRRCPYYKIKKEIFV